MNPNFKNTKVGDSVFNTHSGWGTVIEIDLSRVYPIVVKTGKCNQSFTIDGRCTKSQLAPICWLENDVPQYYLDLFPCPKKKVKKTIERWVNIYEDFTSFGHFSEVEADAYAAEDRIGCVKLTGEYEVEE